MKKWPLRIIYYLTGFLMLSSIHCLIVGIVTGGSIQTFLHSILYLPVVILLSEGQKRVKYFWQFLVVAAGAVVIVRLALGYLGRSGDVTGSMSNNTMGESLEQTLGTILVAAAAALYFYARAKKIECLLEAPEYYYLGLYLLMWFLERQYPSVLLEKYAVIGAGCYLLLCMYKTNIDEMLQFIDLNEKLERFPEKRLLKSNLLMMGFQTVIVGCGMGVILATGADGLLDKIAGSFRRILAWLLSFLEGNIEGAGSEVSGGAAIMPVVEVEERSAFMEMLLRILDILSWVFVIGLTLFVIYKLLKKFYQLYLEFDANSVENGDEIEKIYTVQTREEKRRLKRQKSDNLRWDRSPNARIRKYYKKRVLHDWKEVPHAYMTPEEIEQNIEMSVDKKHIFHTLYEQARYGNVDCSKEDVDKLLKM